MKKINTIILLIGLLIINPVLAQNEENTLIINHIEDPNKEKKRSPKTTLIVFGAISTSMAIIWLIRKIYNPLDNKTNHNSNPRRTQ
jgi:hypothetical protein